MSDFCCSPLPDPTPEKTQPNETKKKMPPSNSVGEDNDDQATVDTSTLLATKDITTADGRSVEALMQRRQEIDRQLKALENVDVGSTSGGSVEGKAKNRLNNNASIAAESYPSHNNNNNNNNNNHSQLSYRPPPQSPEYPYSGALPSKEESIEHTYPPPHQTQRLPPTMFPSHGGPHGGHTRISSSVSVGSAGADSVSFNNAPSVKSHGGAPYSFANPYDPQFLAAAVTAFHQQQHLQHPSIASVGSMGSIKVHKEGNEENKNTSMLWKLLNDKEEELKQVRQTLRETQQKFQEQSLLATKLQTTLDQVQEAFEKERLLIKLQAQKDAQEALTSRQEELFQKQLKWMEDNMSKSISASQPTSQPQETTTTSTSDDASKNEAAKSNDQDTDLATTQNEDLATSKSPNNLTEKQHPYTDVSPNNMAAKDVAPKITPSDSAEQNNSHEIPTNQNTNSIELYPSIDESMSGNNNAENDSAKVSPNPEQNTSLASNAKKSAYIPVNESLSSDRFDPVYVAQNGEKDEGVPKEVPYSSNDDDGSLGQTVASSTYGDDRVKVTNKKLLDPYGDKGTYSGVVLRNTGMPHGLGRMVYEEDRRVFEGDWRHGRWHGYGRASFSNGDSYEGQYKFDQRHGTGIYRWNDGRVYDGQFSEDKRHGKGVFTWPDGAVYDGDFVNGQRQGHGKYTFADGGQYEGSWKDGRYDGFGTCTWEDGRRYRGEWRNGMAHGRGTETYPNGNIRHEGEWVDDEPIR